MNVMGTKFILVVAIFQIALAHPMGEEWFEEFNKNTADRLREHGYPAEHYYIETEDNYIISLFRIPYSHHLQNQEKYRPVVLLQHGLTSSSDNWVLNGPNDGLPYLLSDAGYDVWLGNARGTRYSRNNTRLSPDHPYFWQFSWHEIGYYDMAAAIDYILEKTNESALHYIGHSQGTTVFFVLMSERPEYNDKIKTAHLLAPCAFMSNMTTLLATATVEIVGSPNKITHLLDTMEVLPNTLLFAKIYEKYCKPRPSIDYICRQVYFMIHEANQSPNVNMTIIDHYNETHPAGASSSQMLHFMQEFASGCFCKFDYGERKNLKFYGQTTPPHYDVKRITANMHFYYSDADVMVSVKDVELLASLLPKRPVMHHIPDPTFEHTDFVLALQVKEVVNDPIIKLCDEYEHAQAN